MDSEKYVSTKNFCRNETLEQNMFPLKLKVQGEYLIFECPTFYNITALLYKRFYVIRIYQDLISVRNNLESLILLYIIQIV